jgi:hypothetical protein
MTTRSLSGGRENGGQPLLFAVRLWKEEAGGGSELRGSVRDVVSGAFRSFRAFADLAAFMVERLEEAESRPRPVRADAGTTSSRVDEEARDV